MKKNCALSRELFHSHPPSLFAPSVSLLFYNESGARVVAFVQFVVEILKDVHEQIIDACSQKTGEHG